MASILDSPAVISTSGEPFRFNIPSPASTSTPTPTPAQLVWADPELRARILEHVKSGDLCRVGRLSRRTAREAWARLYKEEWMQDLD
jgi:hypothetical protein